MIGGALIVLFGPANNFFLQSLLYLGVMASVLLIRVPARAQAPRKQAFLKDLGEGYSYAAKSPQIRLLLLMMCINPLFLIPLHLALLPIFAKDIFQAGASGLGVLLASLGAGGVLGGLLTASLNRVDRRGLLQLGAVSVYAVAQGMFSLVGLLTGNLWLSFGFLILAGASEAVYGATNQTVLQLVAPDHLRGRITAILQVQPLLMSLGFFYTGTAADFFPAPAVGMTISGIALALSLGILAFSPRMRALRLSALSAQKQAAPVRA
jgi:hypothetical protein